MNDHIAVGDAPVLPEVRPKSGLLLLLILAAASPLMVPLVLASDLPDESQHALAGLLLSGLPMALMLIVAASIGQPAFAFMKRVAGQDPPPAAVGRTRYRIGAVLVLIAMCVSWFEPLLSPRVAAIADNRVVIGTLADGLVLAGLFVLGGAFWDKLHALFVHDARAVPDTPANPLPGTAEAVAVTWRFWAGVALLLGMLAAWGLVPLASAAGWSAGKVASLTGAVFIANKVLLISAIAIMGKAGFNYLKGLVMGALRRFGPARQVGPGRYRLGLALLMVPVLMTWIAPYVTDLIAPGSVYAFMQELALEALLLVGLFMLGGEFWDKIRALFRHGGMVQFARRAPA